MARARAPRRVATRHLGELGILHRLEQRCSGLPHRQVDQHVAAGRSAVEVRTEESGALSHEPSGLAPRSNGSVHTALRGDNDIEQREWAGGCRKLGLEGQFRAELEEVDRRYAARSTLSRGIERIPQGAPAQIPDTATGRTRCGYDADPSGYCGRSCWKSGLAKASSRRSADSHTATFVSTRLPPVPRYSCAETRPECVFITSESLRHISITASTPSGGATKVLTIITGRPPSSASCPMNGVRGSKSFSVIIEVLGSRSDVAAGARTRSTIVRSSPAFRCQRPGFQDLDTGHHRRAAPTGGRSGSGHSLRTQRSPDLLGSPPPSRGLPQMAEHARESVMSRSAAGFRSVP